MLSNRGEMLFPFKKYYLAWALAGALTAKIAGLFIVYFLFFQGKKIYVDTTVISNILF